MVNKFPEFTGGFNKDYFIQWCVWLFFYLIPEYRKYDLLKIYGVLSTYINFGYTRGIPNGRDKARTNLYAVKRIAEEYMEEAREAQELPDLEKCKKIANDMKAVCDLAECVDGIQGKRKSEFVQLLHGSNLLGIGFRSFYLLVIEKELKLYKNKYSYLFIKREDLTKLI